MPAPPKPILTAPTRPAAAPRPAALSKPTRPRPMLEAFKAAPDPIDQSQNPGDVEGDCDMELGQLETGFRARLAAEADRKQSSTESSYYAVIACETGEQMTALLRALGVEPPMGDLFVDGRVIADKLGIVLPAGGLKYNPGGKPDAKLARLVRPA